MLPRKLLWYRVQAGKNTPTALQEQNLKKIGVAGGIAVVVNEENMNEVLDLIGATHGSVRKKVEQLS
jgi:hypothetical protein